MKHKTENTHKTHYKAAVRLQWRDSMAQHGRLVISCTGTLHMLPTQQTTLCVWTQEVVSAQMWLSLSTITVGLQCMFLMDYSHSDLLDKVVKLHFNLHMHLAQGSFTHLFVLNLFSFFFFVFFLAYLKIIFYGSFKLVFWHKAESSKVGN